MVETFYYRIEIKFKLNPTWLAFPVLYPTREEAEDAAKKLRDEDTLDIRVVENI